MRKETEQEKIERYGKMRYRVSSGTNFLFASDDFDEAYQYFKDMPEALFFTIRK